MVKSTHYSRSQAGCKTATTLIFKLQIYEKFQIEKITIFYLFLVTENLYNTHLL